MKLFLLLITFLFSLNNFSQLVIKESKTETSTIGKVVMMTTNFIECTKDSVNDLYIFRFKNQKLASIYDYRSFYIKGTESFNQLYEIINNTLINKESKDFEIDLGNRETLKISIKGRTVTFWYWNGTSWSYSMEFYPKHINKLFGKV
jgi:hypothetical protein